MLRTKTLHIHQTEALRWSPVSGYGAVIQVANIRLFFGHRLYSSHSLPPFFAFFRILSHSFAFFRILSHSFAFFRILSHSFAFFRYAAYEQDREGLADTHPPLRRRARCLHN
jgi:hypothetical protein